LLGYTVRDRLILTLGFGLGSVFIGVAAVSSAWMFGQVLTTFLLFWSLYEYFTKQRWWLIGILGGCISLSRPTAAPILLFFALELWRVPSKRLWVRRLLPLVVPLVLAIGLQAIYDFARFHNPFENGTQYQLIDPSLAQSRALGVFSLRHIPSNLFLLVFGTPNTVTLTSTSWTLTWPYLRNNIQGTSIFITSPYILYLFGRSWQLFTVTARNLLIAAAVSCLGVLSFYGTGHTQFGYRYSLDFLPEMFVVLMMVYRIEHVRLSRGMKFLLLGSGVFNYLLLLSLLT
jgi:hypothetical protein